MYRLSRVLQAPKFSGFRLCSSTQSSVPHGAKISRENKLLRELCGKIRFTGPITVAEYMREVATNPIHGFYVSQEALGEKGHFVTSPEISQMFGECLALWYINEWMKMGEPHRFQLVELGPGKGTLMSDILRTFAKIKPDILKGVTVHLVEVSNRMKVHQEMVLCGGSGNSVQGSNLTTWGCPVSWHSRLRDVPKQFSFLLAHEFLDALPINKYERTADGWREVLVDIDPSKGGDCLRWVISRHATPSCVLLETMEGVKEAQKLEVSPQAGLVVREMCQRIGEMGGAALIVDYGDLGGDRDTLRAFKNHEQVDPLENPGTADITADVDFQYLRSQVDEHVVMFGPTQQGDFLHACGIGTRCHQLVKASKEGEGDSILASYERLVGKEGMGTRFKVCSLHPASMAEIHAKYPPAGFN